MSFYRDDSKTDSRNKPLLKIKKIKWINTYDNSQSDLTTKKEILAVFLLIGLKIGF
jgi:hypothetical protein